MISSALNKIGFRIVHFGGCLLLLLLLGSGSALSLEPLAYGQVGIGGRHEFTVLRGGLALRAGAGGFIGPIGLEYEATWTADNTFRLAEFRTFERATNWLSLQFRIPLHERFAIVLGAGPGLGWIKPPTRATNGTNRIPSHSFHEYIRGQYVIKDGFFVGLRVDGQHHWQADIVPSPGHSLAVIVCVGIEFFPL